MASTTETTIAVDLLPLREVQLFNQKAIVEIKRECNLEDNSQDWQNSVLIKEEIEIAEDWHFNGEGGGTIYFEPEMCLSGKTWTPEEIKKSSLKSEENAQGVFNCGVKNEVRESFEKDVEVIDLSSDDSIEEKAVSSKPAAPILRRLLEQGPSCDEPGLPQMTEPEFFCKQCGTSTSSASELAIMCAWHTGARPFSCSVCEKSFVTRVQLCVHSIAHSRGQPFPCLICGEEISRMAHFRHHMFIHDDSRNRPPRRCRHCRKTFRGDREWQRHLMRAHREDHLSVNSRSQSKVARAPVGSCCYCGREFTNRGGLRRHELACNNYSAYIRDEEHNKQSVDTNINSVRHKQDIFLP